MNGKNKWNEPNRERERIEMSSELISLGNRRMKKTMMRWIRVGGGNDINFSAVWLIFLFVFLLLSFSVNEVWHDFHAVICSYNNPLDMTRMPYRSFHGVQIKWCPQTYIRNHNKDVYE